MASTRRDLPRRTTRRRALRKAATTSPQPFHFGPEIPQTAVVNSPYSSFTATMPETDRADAAQRDEKTETLRVLLVADSAIAQTAIANRLGNAPGIRPQFMIAANGPGALEAMQREVIELVVIEQPLSDGDAADLIEQIADVGDRAGLIVVGDRDDAESAVRALRSGADDYLVRDQLTSAALGDAVTTAVRTARLEDNNRRLVGRLRENVAKSEHFIRALAHDLSASTMVLESSLARTEASCREEGISCDIREQFVHVSACLANTKRLVDDLVGLAQTGALSSDVCDVDVCQVVNKVLYEQSALIDQRGVAVTVAPELGTALCNANQLHRLLTNLVRNALIHGCDAMWPRLTIEPAASHAGHDAGQLWLRVWDNGGGIPSDVRHQVFEAGKRFGASAGTGLGLAIVERIVTQYGGAVQVDPACHEGTAILFSLSTGERD
ncbi:MAG: hybrid sensor histidine kinase/response regulator [Planctomycetales bacterium]|nr:hybrid sensor histidine kinase/response regulator [Planctomycetales bacterium]